ncbi:MAG: DUF423 domain-containing protein [Endozoicomonas sp.]
MFRNYLLAASISGFLAVGLSAFGAHALKEQLSERLMSVYQTAADYQFYHSLALLLVTVLAYQFPKARFLRLSARFFLAGIIIFSGSLYLLSLTGAGWLGAITPVGGVSLMLGWLMLAIFAVRETSPEIS